MKSSTLIIRPNHVAILVRSVQKSAEFLSQFCFEVASPEVWDGEGTKEIYVEKRKSNSLLLMEAIRPGAYQRALEKRGPGLHHLAIDVLNLEEFLVSIAGSGWLLHPTSVQAMKKTQTTWLARPGFPALIEVQERKELCRESLFVGQIELPIPEDASHLASCIGLGEIIRPAKSNFNISLGQNQILLSTLINGKES